MIGYWLSSEEHAPNALVDNARTAEEAGFKFAMVSDHYHPWIDRQGHSPFVWGVLGALSRATSKMHFVTAVTCPTIRIHPAIIAQASATAACLLEGRFRLGVGAGENLNEHILGDRWPTPGVRLEMLEEAVQVIRKLWRGGEQSFHGNFYTVDNARVYDLPDTPPPLLWAAAGDRSVKMAAEHADGLIGVVSDRELLERFSQAGGQGKPRYGKVAVCWARTREEAERTVYEWWPLAGLGGGLNEELARPSQFEAACETVRPEDVVDSFVCGPDPEAHVEAVREMLDLGYDHVCVHQIGPDQAGFIKFYERKVLPALAPAYRR